MQNKSYQRKDQNRQLMKQRADLLKEHGKNKHGGNPGEEANVFIICVHIIWYTVKVENYAGSYLKKK